MRTNRRLALGAVLLALLVGACTSGEGSQSPSGSAGAPDETQAEEKPPITIGSAEFYESQLMGEIYAQALENAGYEVERNLAIGTREQTQPAIESGQIDLVPEYIGSELTFLGGTASGDPEQTFNNLQNALDGVDLTALDFSPAQDQNAFVVRGETAEEFALETMTDLAGVATELVWGLPPECETNELCAGALEDAYGIPFADLDVEPYAACDAPMATALNDGLIDVAELCSTQPDIERFNFVVLEDDMQTQPADNLAPVVRNEWLDAAPDDFAEILNAVSAAMDTETLLSLGVRVGVDQEDVGTVAGSWLTDQGLLD